MQQPIRLSLLREWCSSKTNMPKYEQIWAIKKSLILNCNLHATGMPPDHLITKMYMRDRKIEIQKVCLIPTHLILHKLFASPIQGINNKID